MINRILIILKKNFFSLDWAIKINKKELPRDTQSFNHLNIFFNHKNNLKIKILTKKYFKKNNSYDENLYYHTFDWLVSAKKIGGAESIYFSRNQLKFWIKEKYSKNSFYWNSNFCAKRLINLIYTFDFYAVSLKESEKTLFKQIILQHFLINSLYLYYKNSNDLSIENSKADLLMRLIYGESIDKTIIFIKKQILENIDINGFHKSYNPVYQAEYINNLIEIKNILLYFKRRLISELDYQIINMTSVLNNLFHKDSSLALFNGSHNMFQKNIFDILKQNDDLKIKKLYKIKNGLAIYSDNDKKIFIDIVKPTNENINKNLHSGTLGFEFSAKKEKIITNCGSINKAYGNIPNYLRYSAAHSTIILNNTNISELDNKKSYVRIPKNINYDYQETNDFISFICSHDGYKESLNKIVKRKITLSKKENTIKCQDTIMPIKLNSKKTAFSIRFHLMPNIQSSLTNSKKKVIIKTKKERNWVFESSNKITIEESIYIGDNNNAHENKQIVINGFVSDTITNINWSLREVKN